jgi:hypothetical protein
VVYVHTIYFYLFFFSFFSLTFLSFQRLYGPLNGAKSLFFFLHWVSESSFSDGSGIHGSDPLNAKVF